MIKSEKCTRTCIYIFLSLPLTSSPSQLQKTHFKSGTIALFQLTMFFEEKYLQVDFFHSQGFF